MKKKIISILAVFCFIFCMLPNSVMASDLEKSETEENVKKVTKSIYYNDEPLVGATISMYIVDDMIEESPKTELGSSTSGQLTVDVDLTKYAGKVLLTEYSLPQGYQFMFDSISYHKVSEYIDDMLGDDQEEYSSWFPVHNIEEDGKLYANISEIRVKQGEMIDLRGANDLEQTGFQLYYEDKEGLKTRVICDYSVEYDQDIYISVDESYMLKAANVGQTSITFVYKNSSFDLPIIVEKNDEQEKETDSSTNSSNNENKIENSTTSKDNQKDESKVVVNSANTSTKEKTFKSETGEDMRQIATDVNDNIMIIGSATVIPAGSKFSSNEVTDENVLKQVSEVIYKQVQNISSYKVYEFNIKDSSNTEIHELNGYINVVIPLPEGLQADNLKSIIVYRLNEDGTLTECDTTIENGKIIFSTNHFSTYIIAEKNSEMTLSPKTGEYNLYYIACMVGIMAIGVLLVFALKKKEAR